MEKVSLFIFWTRSIVLLFSVTIVIVSLGLYPYHEQENMMNTMIQDRRLIATLVASQASIFCPLFLLLATSQKFESRLEQLCQCLMPLGLALSWLCCIRFDQHMAALTQPTTPFLLLDGLKYLILVTLILEVIAVAIGTIYKTQPIQLEDNELLV